MTRVSVISTVYNGEPYFERSVPSILGQTLKDFEWVIVDDGSTDQTPRLLAELARTHSRVRVLSQGRMGRARALNLAVEAAESDYIANQDIDDLSYPERLQLQADYLDAHSEVGVLGGHYLLIDEYRDERYLRMPPERHDDLMLAMATRVPFAHTVTMFRKPGWREAGGYPDVDDGLEDYRLWIIMGNLGWRYASLPVPLGEHTVHSGSFWYRTTAYRARQRCLAQAQLMAIRQLQLPFWMRIYPVGRQFYWSLPVGLKRFARRTLARSRERDRPKALKADL
jgi:glycosyltransferase EpsE